jgi:hypothetical protein
MGKARARQIPVTKTTSAKTAAVFKTVGNQKDRGKVALMQLRESLKAQARGDKSDTPAKAILERIQKQYGDAELQRALREFNLTFKGITRSPAEGKNPRHYGTPELPSSSTLSRKG